MKNKVHSAEQFSEEIIQKRINSVKQKETMKNTSKPVFVDSIKMLKVLIQENKNL